MTFTQLKARLKNFLRGWLLALGLKECLVECATLCVKSEVILSLVKDCERALAVKNPNINLINFYLRKNLIRSFLLLVKLRLCSRSIPMSLIKKKHVGQQCPPRILLIVVSDGHCYCAEGTANIENCKVK